MKALVIKLIPARWRPTIKSIYRSLLHPTPKIKHRYSKASELQALHSVIAYNQHGAYCIPESTLHRPAAKIVFSGDVYEPDTLAYMVRHCSIGDIITAGAFFGDFLPALSSAVDDQAIVWAFEPNRENYRSAQITLLLNDISNVRLDNSGLGERQSKLLLQTTDAYGWALGGASRIVNTTQNHEEKTESINIVTIDEAISNDRNVSILQLDVEGYEKEALSGALQTIRRCRPILILEVFPTSNMETSEWFNQNILALGYRKVDNLHLNVVYSCT